MRLAAIWRYPVKSPGGQQVPSALIEPRGIAHDRRWMMTTPDGAGTIAVGDAVQVI